MSIEAPYSSFKLKNYLIYAAICIAAGAWFTYDGYFNEGYIEMHTDNYGTEEAVADDTLVWNQRLPFVLAAAAVGFVVRWFMAKDFKIIADDEKLVFAKRTILLDSIEKIDKTYFASKGHFTLYYKDACQGECKIKLSDRTYDKLNELLDHIVAKIS
jgi:hypothetical protein